MAIAPAELGGAVHSGTLINSTLVHNSAGSSGGAFSGQGTLLNSLFSLNSVGEEWNDIDAATPLLMDYSFANHITGGMDYGLYNILGDPRLIDPANGDYRLGATSPLLNMGDSSVVEDYPFARNDQDQPIDLDGRPRISGSAIDIGAYER